MKISIICRANSCRSQMAEADHLLAIEAIAEIGIDISPSTTTNINEFVNDDWDYVITVCEVAKESCPVFLGNVKNSIYLKFADPLEYEGDDELLISLIRTTKIQMLNIFEDFYNENIKLNE